MRDVVVTGANGWIGGRVGSILEERGLRVIGVSRHPEQARAKRPQWRWIGAGPELEEAVERAALSADQGRHLGYVRAIAVRSTDRDPDPPIGSIPVEYNEQPLYRIGMPEEHR